MVQVASITLVQNDDARPIIDAIMSDNPGVRVMALHGAVKFDCDNSITINRATVEQNMGRSWEPQEIQLVLISMAGNLDEDDDHFTLSWRH